MKNKNNKTTKYSFSICLLLFAILLLLPQAKALAATYYLDIDGVGEDGILGTADDVISSDTNPGTAVLQPWKTMARAMQNWSGGGTKVIKGDTIYLRDGNYGAINFSWDPTTIENYPTSWDEKILYKKDTGQTPVLTRLEFYYLEPRYLEFDGIDITRPQEEISGGLSLIYNRGASSLRFKNMKLTGYWDTVAKGRISAEGIITSTPTGIGDVSDILIDGCEITHVTRGIVFNQSRPAWGIIIKNNTIHNTANSAIMVSTDYSEDFVHGKILIENNYLYIEENILSYHRITYDMGKKTGTFVNMDDLTQDVTGAKGKWYHYSDGICFIFPTQETPAWEVGAGKTIRDDDNTGVIEDPGSIVLTDYSHSSGIVIEANNLDIRGNIIRAYGSSYPIGIYAIPGLDFVDLTIENNLVYDPPAGHPVTLDNVGGSDGVDANIIVRNNTIIGNHTTGANGYYFNGGLTILPAPGKNGNGVKIYGNIIVGILSLSYGSQVLSDYDEDYNIIYSAISQSNWQTFLKGSHTRIYSNGSSQPIEDFTSNFFIDPDYGHGDNYERYPGDGGPSKRVSDYRLALGSPAINFGDPLNAPATDILGNLRDAQPDAGCYEYGASTFLYGDVSGNAEISAYDAALTAQYSVGLITLTPDQIKAADVSGNGEVSAYDAALIAQKAVGLISKFPVEGG